MSESEDEVDILAEMQQLANNNQNYAERIVTNAADRADANLQEVSKRVDALEKGNRVLQTTLTDIKKGNRVLQTTLTDIKKDQTKTSEAVERCNRFLQAIAEGGQDFASMDDENQQYVITGYEGNEIHVTPLKQTAASVPTSSSANLDSGAKNNADLTGTMDNNTLPAASVPTSSSVNLDTGATNTVDLTTNTVDLTSSMDNSKLISFSGGSTDDFDPSMSSTPRRTPSMSAFTALAGPSKATSKIYVDMEELPRDLRAKLEPFEKVKSSRCSNDKLSDMQRAYFFFKQDEYKRYAKVNKIADKIYWDGVADLIWKNEEEMKKYIRNRVKYFSNKRRLAEIKEEQRKKLKLDH